MERILKFSSSLGPLLLRGLREDWPWLAGFALFGAIFLADAEIGMFSGCALIVLIAGMRAPRKLWALLPAAAVSWTWVYLGRDMYSGYGRTFEAEIAGVSLFPVATWPAVLFLGYVLVFSRLTVASPLRRWLLGSAIYCVGIIAFEYIGYNILGVRLDLGRGYAGWPVLNIFHCPWWMQVAYFLNGIAFFGLCAVVEHRYRLKAGSAASAEGQEDLEEAV